MRTTTTTPDTEGNYFEILNNDETITIILKLKKENKKREIGIISIKERTLYINRSREKHLFRKNNSYGFNDYIIKEGRTFDHVRLNDEFITAFIPKKVIIEKGNYLHFKEIGFERQLFLSLDEISKYTTKPLF